MVRPAMVTYMSFQLLSLCLMTSGAILALWGVLAEHPGNVIRSSYLWSNGPGRINAIFNADTIAGYVHHRNKATVSIVLISLGFILALPVFNDRVIPVAVLVLVVCLILLFVALVPGATRRLVIEKWRAQDCPIRWFFDLLEDSHFESELKRWAGSGQRDGHIRNTLVYLTHIRKALEIDIGSDPSDGRDISLNELADFGRRLKKETDNTSLFYHLRRPIKLLKAYK